MNELHADDIAALRELVRRRATRHAARAWPSFRLLGGPLQGLWVKLEPACAASAFVGFCHLTSVGLIQAIYRKVSARELRFHTIVWPRGRMPAMPKNPFEPPKPSRCDPPPMRRRRRSSRK
ncbi:MAG TPA: hypothetical protein P5081_22775 [Phycisphaerae bacterium]|nr:hypothetical protein [Phycisphaerae bacterium]HRW55708.1 hypothetical protein [Phycisphaerae bacterium]